jgi:Guanylylate cyclase
MVTAKSNNSSSDDAAQQEAATTRAAATTTGEPAALHQQSSSSSSSNSDRPREYSSDETTGSAAWENAVEKLPVQLESSSPPPPSIRAAGQQNKGNYNDNAAAAAAATRLRHVRQLDSWDCGVACLLMVWEWFNEESSHRDDIMMNHSQQQSAAGEDIDDYQQREVVRREWILEQIATRSVWTVDLVYILDLMMQRPPQSMPMPPEAMQMNVLFGSNSLQVNESLHGMEYYTKNFEHDRHRVRHRFGAIRQSGRIALLQHPSKSTRGGGLPLAQVVRLIQQPDCVAIVLVDNSVLTCSIKVALASTENQQPTEPATSAAAPYTGHFIIVTGTSRDLKHLKQASTTSTASSTNSTAPRGNDDDDDDDYCFVANNPGVDETVSYICPSLLERAWRAEGTDEDIIFLYKTAKVAVPT